MQERTELYDMRLHRLEQLTTSMVDSQASMVQVLQAHSARLERIDERLDKIEADIAEMREILTQMADDLGFIKNYLKSQQ